MLTRTIMCRSPLISSWLFLILIGSILPAQEPQDCADTVQLVDGRFVTGRPMTETPAGVVIHYEHGDVLLKKELVKEAFTSRFEGVEHEYSEEEKERLAAGEVLFDGKWMKIARRDSLLERRREKQRARLVEAQKHQKWRDRYITKTKNFEFHYTIDPDQMEKYMELMETYYTVFTREWRIRKESKAERLKVCFYHNADYYHQVSGASAGVIGYFRFVPPQELHFYYDRLDERMTIDVMFHETNHYLTQLIEPRFAYPPWVNESLAEYYGASTWDPDKKKMTVGNIQAGRLTVIQDQIAGNEWQSLEGMIRLQHGEFNAIHYAWGWSFVHFLLESKQYAAKFKKFYIALARERSIKHESWNFGMYTVNADEQIKALLAYLDVADLKTLEKEWHDYVKGLEATGGRGYSEAGEQVLARGMPIKAQRFFKTAIEKGYETPTTWYGLGRACLQKEKYAEAADAFRKAIEGDPLNGSFYTNLARAISGPSAGPKEGEAASPTEKEIDRLRKLAAEIDPDNWEVMVSVELSGGD
ncbi:MAG: tetratricopeptide repeat protein [Planctomycetes bacterium]|nr:tetratricopeptide repeat protein [Planctomycetota bacterium]